MAQEPTVYNRQSTAQAGVSVPICKVQPVVQALSDNVPPTIGTSHTNLRDAVLNAIRHRIQDGSYKPGTRLQEEVLASDLEVSRNPVREALQTLAREGFVVIEPRRGARVASIDAERAAELFEVRRALERLVAELAAVKGTPDQRSALDRIVNDGRTAVGQRRLEQLPMLNTEFHAQLSRMAQNSILEETLDRLSGIIRWIYTDRLSDRLMDSWDEHFAIAQAIIAGDATSAGVLAAEHVTSARDAFLRHRT